MRISIIEDNEPVSTSLANVFQSRGDETDCFISGEAFFASNAQTGADCILVDLQLPGMNGCEIIQNLRENSIHTPAILLSGSIDDVLLNAITQYANVMVLRKPCSAGDLYQSIDKLCAQTCL